MKKYIFILLALILFNCGSKKKTINKTKSEIDLKIAIDSTSVKESVYIEKTKEIISSEEFETEESFEYEGKVGDSLKIIKKGADGKIISETIFTGAGKITKTSKSKKKKLTSENSKIDSTFTKAKTTLKKDIEEKRSDENKQVTIEKSGWSFGTFLWVFLILGIIVGVYYLDTKFGFIKRDINFLK